MSTDGAKVQLNSEAKLLLEKLGTIFNLACEIRTKTITLDESLFGCTGDEGTPEDVSPPSNGLFHKAYRVIEDTIQKQEKTLQMLEGMNTRADN